MMHYKLKCSRNTIKT